MNEKIYVKSFYMDKYDYPKHHTTGDFITFTNPCIGYLLHGTAEFLYHGKTLSASEGDLIYIAAGTKYYSFWQGEPRVVFYSLSFSFTDRKAFSSFPFQILKNYPSDIFDEIFASYENNHTESLGKFYLLLSDLSEKLTVGNPALSAVLPAIEYIEQNYNKSITVSHLASLCNYSEPHFYAAFKKATGVSPINYKHNVCIQHALYLLTQTDMPVEEVSWRSGFSSSNHFRNVFFKILGKSPKDVR